jgi:hypothetical protein
MRKKLFGRLLMKGGETKMKTLTMILIAAVLILGMAVEAKAISLTVEAQVASGASLGSHMLLTCYGYKVVGDGTTFDPWASGNCSTQEKNGTILDFGILSTRLRNVDGTDNGGADCFYGENFFVVYLYPDCWGGKGYDLTQSPATFSDTNIGKAVVFTPVYSSKDKYSTTGAEQGAMISTEITNNPNVNKAILATTGGRIFKAKRARIVRAQYGIPPKPATGDTRPTGWAPIPVTQASGSYSGQITITLTEWQ